MRLQRTAMTLVSSSLLKSFPRDPKGSTYRRVCEPSRRLLAVLITNPISMKHDQPVPLNHVDSDYTKAVAAITHGKRMPYTEYVHQRALYYIEVLATDAQIAELQETILARTTTP